MKLINIFINNMFVIYEHTTDTINNSSSYDNIYINSNGTNIIGSYYLIHY